MKFEEVFKSNKPIIGMIHLDYLPHQQKFKGYNLLIKKAIDDLKNLEEGGVDAVMIENWKDESSFPFVNKKSIEAMTKISKIIVKKTALPVGINVLPNDYKSAFSIAKAEGLQFVQLDVFVDKVNLEVIFSTPTRKISFNPKLRKSYPLMLVIKVS